MDIGLLDAILQVNKYFKIHLSRSFIFQKTNSLQMKELMQFLRNESQNIKTDSTKVRNQRKMRMERTKMVEYGKLQKLFAAIPVHSR